MGLTQDSTDCQSWEFVPSWSREVSNILQTPQEELNFCFAHPPVWAPLGVWVYILSSSLDPQEPWQLGWGPTSLWFWRRGEGFRYYILCHFIYFIIWGNLFWLPPLEKKKWQSCLERVSPGQLRKCPQYNMLFLLPHQNAKVAICKDVIWTERELAVWWLGQIASVKMKLHQW